jgi:hypothetical protein
MHSLSLWLGDVSFVNLFLIIILNLVQDKAPKLIAVRILALLLFQYLFEFRVCSWFLHFILFAIPLMSILDSRARDSRGLRVKFSENMNLLTGDPALGCFYYCLNEGCLLLLRCLRHDRNLLSKYFSCPLVEIEVH